MRPRLARLRKEASTALVVGALVSLAGMLQSLPRFFQAYLFATITWVGISIGCVGILMLYRLVGGLWGRASLPVVEACAKTTPWAGLLFIPILAWAGQIYPWVHGEHLNPHQQLFFGHGFYVARTIGYFVLWTWFVRRLTHPRAPEGTSGLAREYHRLGAVGLLIYVISVSFASFDWIMSLEPHWSSSIYGAMIMTGFVLSGYAFTVFALNLMGPPLPPAGDDATAQASLDLGNLLLAFTMLWAYMALSQYLIIWSGNIPEEITWYLARGRGGWRVVTTLLILGQFALPFLMLLVRRNKQRLATLARVAVFILIMRIVDCYWLVMPEYSPGQFRFHFVDAGALLLVGGVWLLSFTRQMAEVPYGS